MKTKYSKTNKARAPWSKQKTTTIKSLNHPSYPYLSCLPSSSSVIVHANIQPQPPKTKSPTHCKK